MRRSRTPRSWLLTGLLAAVLLYLVVGHAAHGGDGMDGAAMGAGICIVLVTAVTVALGAINPAAPMVLELLAPARLATAEPAPAQEDARGSPAWLERFLS